MVRVRVIDMLRGVCMIYIVIGHVGRFWLSQEASWVFCYVFSFSEVIGASMFLFLSGVSFSMSIRGRQEKEKQNPNQLRPPLWKEIHSRTLFIFLFGFLYNILSGWHSFWVHTILQTIAFSRVLMLPFMQKSRRWRSYLAGIVIAISPFAYGLLYPNPSANWIQNFTYNFLFFLPDHEIILPFFAFFIVGTIIGDLFWDRRNALFETGYEEMKHILLKYGAILFVTGIFMGMCLTDWDYGWNILSTVNLNPWFNFSGIPLFLLRATPPWVIMSMGAQMGILAFLCHIEKYPRIRYGESRFLSVLSAQSLTIFFWHYISYPLLFETLDGYTLWIPDIAFFMIVWSVTWIWVRKYHSKYSIEWMIGMGSRVLLRKYYVKGQSTAT